MGRAEEASLLADEVTFLRERMEWLLELSRLFEFGININEIAAVNLLVHSHTLLLCFCNLSHFLSHLL